ncbi:MAG TPA: VOC family protein [Salinimicrobium sp.]|nr:VOC family protein [Salinimicrobium sp.]
MKIQELKIQTSNPTNQLEFYGGVLGLPILTQNQTGFAVKIGYSVLKFHKTSSFQPYHIAFHIGAHQEKEAIKWLQKRVSILKNEGENIVDFPAWNAKSIYFYDEDSNIIEFISRRHLFPSKSIFSEKSMVGIAEIGLSTNTVEKFFRFLNTNFELEIYFGKPDIFCVIGDDDGLLITVDQNHKTWFPTNDLALPADFSLKFKHERKQFGLNYEKNELSVMKC